MGVRKGGLRGLIDGYKFRYQKSAARLLAELVDVQLPSGAVIVPVPTARTHVRQRGYDHTLLLAKELSRKASLSYALLLLSLTTVTQHFAPRRQRYLQAEGLFRATKTLDPDTPYVLIDDIITTGSTILAAAGALRDAGAKIVIVIVIARQPLD